MLFVKRAGWWALNTLPLGPLAPYLMGWLIGSMPHAKKD